MARILDTEHCGPALAAMLGCSDVGDGPTDEQRRLVTALAHGYYRVPFDPAEATPLEPDQVAAAFPDPAQRRRVLQLLVLVEACRHPQLAEQVERTERYAAALGCSDDASLAIARDLVQQHTEQARTDFRRAFERAEPTLREPELAGAPGSRPLTQDAATAARIEALRDLAPGTLGRSYIDFYERYGFDLPGTSDQDAAVFVAHDMSHVIAGYEPDGVGEIALGAMQLGMTDSDEHWVQFLGNLAVHELGYLGAGAPDPALGRPDAADVVAHAFDRGARCTADFSLVDHLSMAAEPLEDVRARFGVPPRLR